MLFCHPESEAKAAKHKGLGKEQGLSSLPSVGFLEPDGAVIVQVPPAVHSVARFEHYGQRARQLLRWRAAARKGDARAAAALLIAQLEERQLLRPAAEARRVLLTDETADERKRLDELMLELRIGEELAAAQQDTAARHKLGTKYLAMLASGTRPSDSVSRGFWYVILEGSEAAGDATGFAIGLAGLRRNIELTSDGAPWGAKMLADYEAKLARLRPGK